MAIGLDEPVPFVVENQPTKIWHCQTASLLVFYRHVFGAEVGNQTENQGGDAGTDEAFNVSSIPFFVFLDVLQSSICDGFDQCLSWPVNPFLPSAYLGGFPIQRH
jgi:hypothetical protein